MKAVVLEIKDEYAAVLSEDGQFIKIKDDGYVPGMELTLEEKKDKQESAKIINLKNRRFWQNAVAVAAALFIVIGVKDFNTPYSIVSIDVNPSIEISINRYDRVLSVEAVNDDAEEIVTLLNADGVKYKSVDDAVDMALTSFSDGDYSADDGETYVMISANSKNVERSGKIVDSLEKCCKGHADISAQIITADDELVEKARELGTTAGKLYLVESLKDVSADDDFDESDWLKKPVKDIIHEIDSCEPKADAVPPSKDAEAPQSAPESDKTLPVQDDEIVPEKTVNQDQPSDAGTQNNVPDNPALNFDAPEKPDDEVVPDKPNNQDQPSDAGTQNNVPDNPAFDSDAPEKPDDEVVPDKPNNQDQPSDTGAENNAPEKPDGDGGSRPEVPETSNPEGRP